MARDAIYEDVQDYQRESSTARSNERRLRTPAVTYDANFHYERVDAVGNYEPVSTTTPVGSVPTSDYYDDTTNGVRVAPTRNKSTTEDGDESTGDTSVISTIMEETNVNDRKTVGIYDLTKCEAYNSAYIDAGITEQPREAALMSEGASATDEYYFTNCTAYSLAKEAGKTNGNERERNNAPVYTSEAAAAGSLTYDITACAAYSPIDKQPVRGRVANGEDANVMSSSATYDYTNCLAYQATTVGYNILETSIKPDSAEESDDGKDDDSDDDEDDDSDDNDDNSDEDDDSDIIQDDEDNDGCDIDQSNDQGGGGDANQDGIKDYQDDINDVQDGINDDQDDINDAHADSDDDEDDKEFWIVPGLRGTLHDCQSQQEQVLLSESIKWNLPPSEQEEN